MRHYEYRHIVGFEETNLVGNVYYVNHLRWQGRCREMFLRDHGVDILSDFSGGLAIVTVRVACEYLAELSAFDELSIRMTLGGLAQNRAVLRFEYWRVGGARDGDARDGDARPPMLIARGEQEIAFMQRAAGGLVAAPIPARLRDVLLEYSPRTLPV